MQFRSKWAIGLLSLGLVAAPVFVAGVRAEDAPKEKPAGGQRGPTAGLDRYHDAVMKLDLSADQKTKLDPLFADAKTKVTAAASDAGTDPKAVREKVKPIMDDLRKQVSAILTDEQNKKLEASRPRRGQGGNGNKPPQ
ncbi:MAG TPA: hypothetical protein VG269_22270 [Tepidisphaeraceae bacterium]|jgi:hypothetical protein|nr:hypothetical protein [Tepidisphaeraceae bacterium]